ncbi:MAG: DUF2029 domain-containing protein [Candidatus Lokiarchaeota archaeon]|nr:DUF2029 domain-containing protein [Candidatus Lokiarchaeota archaeon]MBD3200062.1 DUF2029 domain-containing protein [Candidatus Lokiarchaeota archaeon]
MEDNLSQIKTANNTHKTIIQITIISIIGVTIIFVILRILIGLYEFPDFFELSKDGDFYILYDAQKEGLFKYYDYTNKLRPPIYLYHWYFLFFPFGIIPANISVYLWDIFRVVIYIYIILNIYKISESRKNEYLFVVISFIGFFFDAYLGNSNFLVLFFLFFSHIYLKQGRVWIAGIFFALATFKLVACILPIIYLLIRELDLKSFIKYIIPFLLLLVPFLIFPSYFLQFIENLLFLEDYKGDPVQPNFGNDILNAIAAFFLFIWQAFQQAQLMYYSFFLLIILNYIRIRKIEKETKLEN